MTAAELAPSPVSRARAVRRCAAFLWIVALLAVGFGLWAVLRQEPSAVYYVVKWPENGRCSVTAERPERPGVRTLWFSTLHDTAAQRVRELREQRRCA